jgi:hypothetical protein
MDEKDFATRAVAIAARKIREELLSRMIYVPRAGEDHLKLIKKVLEPYCLGHWRDL